MSGTVVVFVICINVLCDKKKKKSNMDTGAAYSHLRIKQNVLLVLKQGKVACLQKIKIHLKN